VANAEFVWLREEGIRLPNRGSAQVQLRRIPDLWRPQSAQRLHWDECIHSTVSHMHPQQCCWVL
ncbi:hypothetical protein Ciccas_013464, partial [Cichlidogyrus casuarinus]